MRVVSFTRKVMDRLVYPASISNLLSWSWGKAHIYHLHSKKTMSPILVGIFSSVFAVA